MRVALGLIGSPIGADFVTFSDATEFVAAMSRLELRDDAEPTSRAEFGAVAVVAVRISGRVRPNAIGDVTHNFNRFGRTPL